MFTSPSNTSTHTLTNAPPLNVSYHSVLCHTRLLKRSEMEEKTVRSCRPPLFMHMSTVIVNQGAPAVTVVPVVRVP